MGRVTKSFFCVALQKVLYVLCYEKLRYKKISMETEDCNKVEFRRVDYKMTARSAVKTILSEGCRRPSHTIKIIGKDIYNRVE